MIRSTYRKYCTRVPINNVKIIFETKEQFSFVTLGILVKIRLRKIVLIILSALQIFMWEVLVQSEEISNKMLLLTFV